MANTPANPEDAFLREVDEEYRRSQLANLWKRFGTLAIAALILALAGLAGWLFWQDRQEKAAGGLGLGVEGLHEDAVFEGANGGHGLDLLKVDECVRVGRMDQWA